MLQTKQYFSFFYVDFYFQDAPLSNASGIVNTSWKQTKENQR